MNKTKWSDWWQLLRAGNVFTAVSNVLAGFLLVRGEWQPLLPLVMLAATSALLYLAGMVLNDVFDLEIDRVERPDRPLPAGRIPPIAAKRVGWLLLFGGLTLAGVVGSLVESWLPLTMSGLLALAIVGYDALLKSTVAGPWTMALCRSLNVLLGASLVEHSSDKSSAYVYAAAIGVYTLGLTLLARNEAGETTPRAIKKSANVIQIALIGFLAIAAFETLPAYGWIAGWLIVVFAARIAVFEAFLDPTPSSVQKAVSRLIMLFIPLDALAGAAGTDWIAGLVILSLMVPTYVATRRIAMT
ncbi:MAG: UbiA family prenyltransferase [Planctomycetota bacterium]